MSVELVEQRGKSRRLRMAIADNLYLNRPSPAFVTQVLEEQSSCELSYDQVGASEYGPVQGWDWHREDRPLGHGQDVWNAAKAALRTWAQFDMSWVFPLDRTVPLEVGANFAFTSKQLGLWSVNVCRVVKTIDDEKDGVRRFGFAYGTLEKHAVRGEELFLLEFDVQTKAVRFVIQKFSKPSVWLARMAAPVTRHLQAKFTYDALRRFEQEVCP